MTATSAMGWAPGRVNLIGDHTDYNDGYVLPMAIHLGVTATVTRRRDDVVTISSAQVPDDPVHLLMGDLRSGEELLGNGTSLPGWASYVAGSIWSVGQEHPLTHGVDVVIDGDVPLGAGLSSSAAVECAVIVALAAVMGLRNSRREWARIAQRAENDFVGVPTGSMDQVASMLGEQGSALFYDVRADSVTPVALDLEGAEFLVIDTRASHALVDGGYAARRADCEAACEVLRISALRDVTDLDAGLVLLAGQPRGSRLVARTRHVVTENARVVAAEEALRSHDVRAFGDLMVASHESLRDDYDVSCDELNVAVESALAAGAWGARMTGGGFGGSAVALVPGGLRTAVTAGVEEAFAAAGFGAPRVLPVAPGAGAHVFMQNL